MTRAVMVRLFWGGLVILVTAALLLRVVPVAAPTNPEDVEPLNMPDFGGVDAVVAEYGDSGILVGERNPFDPKGDRWTAAPITEERVASKAPRRGAPGGIRGVFKVPGVEGVLTDDGFISVGETVQGVRVQKVEREEVTFSLDRNETATWVNAERDRRRKAFERRGLHLGNEEDRTP